MDWFHAFDRKKVIRFIGSCIDKELCKVHNHHRGKHLTDKDINPFLIDYKTQLEISTYVGFDVSLVAKILVNKFRQHGYKSYENC